MKAKVIYLGVKGSVVAVDSANGRELWAVALKSTDFVNVMLDDDNLYATTRGEIFCLDPKTGAIRWHNPLKGYGLGLVSITAQGINAHSPTALAAEKRRREQQAAAASSSTAAAGSS